MRPAICLHSAHEVAASHLPALSTWPSSLHLPAFCTWGSICLHSAHEVAASHLPAFCTWSSICLHSAHEVTASSTADETYWPKCVLRSGLFPYGYRQIWLMHLPVHPSTADEAWYWLKRVLHSGWLYITSRPIFFRKTWFIDGYVMGGLESLKWRYYKQELRRHNTAPCAQCRCTVKRFRLHYRPLWKSHGFLTLALF